MKTEQVLKKYALVADNDAVILESFAGRLRHLGFKVITANSGDEAFDLYNKFYPDIVIIDEGLKKIDGLELFFRLFFRNPFIKIILTTRDKQVIENNENDNSEYFVVVKKRISDYELRRIFRNSNHIPEIPEVDFL